MKTNNLDVVYTVRVGNDNDELRHSLRSLKNMPHRKVWIVGFLPNFVKDIEYIQNRPISRNKIANTDHNWLRVARVSGVSDPFILMNDDFIINKPIKDMKSYYFGKHDNFLNYYETTYPASNYTRIIKNTKDRLYRLGIDTQKALSYELHMPMIVYKDDIIKAIQGENYRWYPVNIRTLVGNIGSYGGKNCQDVKVYNVDDQLNDYQNLDFISTEDKTFYQSAIGDYIRETFNERCKYEN